jgi:hypothetical protein
MQSVSFGDGNTNCGNISGSFNTFICPTRMRKLCVGSLHWSQITDIRASALTDSMVLGNWLLETREFREWRCSEGGADNKVLFCSGNPGVGKTYLR